MSTILDLERDVAGNTAYAPIPCTNNYSATLTNGVAATITIPGNHAVWVVSFSYQPGSNVWVDFTGATAAVPVGATFAATTSELNPGARKVKAFSNAGVAQTISLITDNATTDVGVTFYVVSYP